MVQHCSLDSALALLKHCRDSAYELLLVQNTLHAHILPQQTLLHTICCVLILVSSSVNTEPLTDSENESNRRLHLMGNESIRCTVVDEAKPWHRTHLHVKLNLDH